MTHVEELASYVVRQKFERLATPHADASLRTAIVNAVASLESIRATDLMALLSKAHKNV